jgi:hypothetical protein
VLSGRGASPGTVLVVRDPALGQDPDYLDQVLDRAASADQQRTMEVETEESSQQGIVEMLRKADEKLEEILIIQRDIVHRIGSQLNVELDLKGYRPHAGKS